MEIFWGRAESNKSEAESITFYTWLRSLLHYADSEALSRSDRVFASRLDDTFVCCFTLLTAGTKQISYNDTAQVLKVESVEKILLVSACRSQQSSRDVVILIRWRFKTLGKQQAAGNSD